MFFQFKSQATAPFKIAETDARTLLTIIGKDASTQGVITVEEIPDALARLQAAVRHEAEQGKHNHDAHVVDDHADKAEVQHVGLHQRATPLINMLQESKSAGKSVVWGV